MKEAVNRFRLLSLLVLIISCCACSKKYSCGGNIPMASCQPVSSVYKQSNENFEDYRSTLNEEGNQRVQKAHDRLKATNYNELQYAPLQARNNQTTFIQDYISPGQAILSKPKVMRILFNGWKDEEKDYHAGGYVYIKLEESDWVIE